MLTPFYDPSIKEEKKFLKISYRIKSGERRNTIDHLEFTVSRKVILLFLKNDIRYLSSVLIKTLLGACSRRWKKLKIAFIIKSTEWSRQTDRQTDWQIDTGLF